MALFKCEACGAALEITEGSDIAFCPYCGMKQSLPKDPVQILTDGTNIENLLERGFMLLEDEKFQKADEYFDRVLEIDSKKAKAYLGKVLAELKLSWDFELATTSANLNRNNNFKRALKFADPELKKELRHYKQEADLWRKEYGDYITDIETETENELETKSRSESNFDFDSSVSSGSFHKFENTVQAINAAQKFSLRGHLFWWCVFMPVCYSIPATFAAVIFLSHWKDGLVFEYFFEYIFAGIVGAWVEILVDHKKVRRNEEMERLIKIGAILGCIFFSCYLFIKFN